MKNELNMTRMIQLSVLALIVAFAISGYAWLQLPAGEQIPVHFDASGQPDRYGGKFEGLMMLPLVMAGMCVLLAVLPRIDPRRSNIAASMKAYQMVWGGTLIFMMIIHVVVILNVLGYIVNAVTFIPFGIGILFVVIGNFLGKTRSNWFMGIKTPWTLSSDLAWDKTHRLGGKLFIALGIFFALSGFIGVSERWFGLLTGGVLVMTVFLYGYSYYIWKNDPNKLEVGS